MSRALGPRQPVSRRLTFDVPTRSWSATCSAVQPYVLLSSLSRTPRVPCAGLSGFRRQRPAGSLADYGDDELMSELARRLGGRG
jgi:hypothetical protein